MTLLVCEYASPQRPVVTHSLVYFLQSPLKVCILIQHPPTDHLSDYSSLPPRRQI